MKRTLPLTLVFVLGVIYFFVPFISHPFSVDILQKEVYQNWIKIMGVFAVVMSVTSLWRRNAVKIKRKHGDYIYSYLEIGGMLVMTIFAIVVPAITVGKVTLGGIGEHTVYDWIFRNMQVPMQATMFSMLAFYIASASYRAFRARNLEATLLLITAGIVMIGRVPLGNAIYTFMLQLNGDAAFRWSEIFNFQAITQFILDVPNTATKRAIIFGVSMGMMATSLKIIFGIEKSWLGGK